MQSEASWGILTIKINSILFLCTINICTSNVLFSISLNALYNLIWLASKIHTIFGSKDITTSTCNLT